MYYINMGGKHTRIKRQKRKIRKVTREAIREILINKNIGGNARPGIGTSFKHGQESQKGSRYQ